MSVNLLSYAWTILSYLIIIEEAIMKRVGELRRSSESARAGRISSFTHY
jgi:hypothetical protein